MIRSPTSTASTPLSSLARDPTLRALFECSQRGIGAAFAIPATNPPALSGGAAAPVVRVLETAEA